MFSDKSPNAELKLIDFGLSKVYFLNFPPSLQILTANQYTHSVVGTRNYIAPEVYMRDYQGSGYTKSCDMWSLGIICYFLLTGRNPLPSQPCTGPLQQLPGKIPYPRKYWNSISPEAKQFVEGLLQFDPAKRLTGRSSAGVSSSSLAGAGAPVAASAVPRGSEAVPHESRAEPAGVSGVQPAEEGGDDRGGVPSEQRGRSPRG